MCVGAMRVGAGQQLWYVRVQRPGCGVKCASGGVVVRGWLSLRRAGGSMRRAGLVFNAARWVGVRCGVLVVRCGVLGWCSLRRAGGSMRRAGGSMRRAGGSMRWLPCSHNNQQLTFSGMTLPSSSSRTIATFRPGCPTALAQPAHRHFRSLLTSQLHLGVLCFGRNRAKQCTCMTRILTLCLTRPAAHVFESLN